MISIYNSKKCNCSYITNALFVLVSFYIFSTCMARDALAETYAISKTIEIIYGKEEGQLGFIDEKEMPEIGPSSFTSDDEGNLYICDIVNRRIQIRDRQGAYLKTVVLPKTIAPIDIGVNEWGRMFIYDHSTRKLHQVDHAGIVTSSIQLDQAATSCLNTLHMVGNDIYRRTCGQNQILIGQIQNQRLVKPDRPVPKGVVSGFLSPSSKLYTLELLRKKKATVHLYESYKSDRKKMKELDIESPLSLKFLNEDRYGYFYLRVERKVDAQVILEVRKYNAFGDQLCVLLIGDRNYAVWPIKLFSVDAEGRIWQLVPGAEAARLHLYTSSQ